MPILTDLQGDAISWEEIKRRNAEWHATHDRHGGPLPVMEAVDRVLQLAHPRPAIAVSTPIPSRYKPPTAAEAKRRTDERAAQILAERRAVLL